MHSQLKCTATDLAFQQMARRPQNQYAMCSRLTKLKRNENGNEHVEM